MTPTNDFRLKKGDTKRIAMNLEHKRNHTEEDLIETLENFNENKCVVNKDQEKLAEEKCISC